MRALIFIFLTILCAQAEERILGYGSEIRVGRDGYLDVVEKIRVNVEGNRISRGIFRDFPQEYDTKWGLKQWRPFEVTGVKRNGLAEPYKVERLGSGTRVRIGSADVFLEAGSEQEYEIAYRTGGQLWFDEKGDELYWNVTGNFWDFPILEAEAKVILPDGIAVQEAEAFTGSKGAKGTDYEKTEETDGVSFRTNAPLGSGEGLTVVVRWEPGKLDAAAYRKPGIWRGNMVMFLGLALVVAGLLVFVLFWVGFGIDPARGIIVPGWEPPEGFSPAAVRYLSNMGFDDRCFTAAVLALASKGYLKIEEYGVDTYKLLKKKGSTPLTPDEDVLHVSLFSGGKSLLLDNANHALISSAKMNLTSVLKEKVKGVHFHGHGLKWFVGVLVCLCGLFLISLTADETPAVLALMVFAAVMSGWIGVMAARIRSGSGSKPVACVILVLPVALGGCALVLIGMAAGILAAIATLVAMLAAMVFQHLMKAPTRAGRKVLDVIAGFREYLSVAEEDRLNLENPPQRTPELFERFLPYALALGAEQKWSEKFDDVLSAAGKEQGSQNYQPSFYTGGRSGLENALSGAAIGAALGGALASASMAPSSSGSSGGGGGGGSSGGGGGGGGGGGW